MLGSRGGGLSHTVLGGSGICGQFHARASPTSQGVEPFEVIGSESLSLTPVRSLVPGAPIYSSSSRLVFSGQNVAGIPGNRLRSPEGYVRRPRNGRESRELSQARGGSSR